MNEAIAVELPAGKRLVLRLTDHALSELAYAMIDVPEFGNLEERAAVLSEATRRLVMKEAR